MAEPNGRTLPRSPSLSLPPLFLFLSFSVALKHVGGWVGGRSRPEVWVRPGSVWGHGENRLMKLEPFAHKTWLLLAAGPSTALLSL